MNINSIGVNFGSRKIPRTNANKNSSMPRKIGAPSKETINGGSLTMLAGYLGSVAAASQQSRLAMFGSCAVMIIGATLVYKKK